LISSLLWKLKTKGWTSNWCRKAKVLYICIFALGYRVETKLSRLMSRRRHINIWKTWIIQSICLVHLGKMVIFFTLIFRICNGDFEKYFVMVTCFYELYSLLMTVLAFFVLFEPSVTSRICNMGPSSEISTLTCMKRGTFCVLIPSISEQSRLLKWHAFVEHRCSSFLNHIFFFLIVITDTNAMWFSNLEKLRCSDLSNHSRFHFVTSSCISVTNSFFGLCPGVYISCFKWKDCCW